MLLSGPTAAQSLLPTGFGTVNIGAAWDEVSAGFDFRDLSDASTLLERLNQECGYKTALVNSDDGDLLITVNDFIVTDLSYATPLEPNSDLMAVADLVMQTYGQPKSATMRDAIGKATLDRARVSHIELRYDAKNPVTFYISGAAVWQYQINVQYAQKRWHQNKNTRCARQRAKTLRAAAKAKPTQPKDDDQ
ncbi:MAG: hypothetical protein AAF458_24755 [Pseudomonadota bacterium]